MILFLSSAALQAFLFFFFSFLLSLSLSLSGFHVYLSVRPLPSCIAQPPPLHVAAHAGPLHTHRSSGYGQSPRASTGASSIPGRKPLLAQRSGGGGGGGGGDDDDDHGVGFGGGDGSKAADLAARKVTSRDHI